MEATLPKGLETLVSCEACRVRMDPEICEALTRVSRCCYSLAELVLALSQPWLD